MTKPSTASPEREAVRHTPRWKRWSFVATLLLVCYALLGFLGIPLLVGWIAPSQIAKQLDREVTLKSVRFNPFTFECEISDLDIKDPDGSSLLSWNRFRLNFEFTSIFRGPWRFREIVLDAPSIRAQVNPDYRFNFSDLIEKFGSTAEDSPQPESPDEPLPALIIDYLAITNFAATYADLTTTQPFHLEATPINLVARDFRTSPGHTNGFRLEGKTDIGMGFELDGELQLSPPELTSHVEVTNIALNSLEAFYSEYLNLKIRAGTVDLTSDVHLRVGGDSETAQLRDTLFSLRGLRVGLADLATNLAELDTLVVRAPFADAWQRDAHIESVALAGARLKVHRRADLSLEIVEAAQPRQTEKEAPATVALTFNAVSNIATVFSGNTNVGLARLDQLVLTNSNVELLDEAPGIPVQVIVSDIFARVQNVSTAPDAKPTAHVSFLWQTNGTFSLETTAQATPPAIEVDVALQQWNLSAADAYISQFANVRLQESALNFAGHASLLVPPDSEPEGRFHGSMSIHQFKTSHGSDMANLLHWEDFSIDGITVDLHPMDIHVDTVSLSAPEVWGVLHTNGTVNLLTAANLTNAVITASTSSGAVDSTVTETPVTGLEVEPRTEPTTANLPPFRVGGILITNAILHLTDELTEPHAHLTVNPLNVYVSDLNSADLQSLNVSSSGSLEPSGNFALEARLRPLDGTNTTALRLTTEGIDLSPTDPYVRRFLGYQLDRGTLSTELDYQLNNRQLDGQNRVVLNQLALGSPVESPDAIKAPIKLGIKVLQDRQGRIELKVPVQGSLDDPQFDIGKVISGAFANVFTKVLTSPFSVLGGLLGEGEPEDLERVAFAPGSSEIDKDGLKRLGKLEKVLYERPALNLELLALVDQKQDAAALRELRLSEQLTELRSTAGESGEDTSSADEAQLIAQAYRELHGLPLPGAAEKANESLVTQAPHTAELESTAPIQKSIRLTQRLRGGERMMQRRLRSTSEQETPTPDSGSAAEEGTTTESNQPEPGPETAPLPSVAAMRTALLDAIAIPDESLDELGDKRQEAVRTALLQSGRIEPERITPKTLSGTAPTGTEVRFSLQ